MSRTAFDTYRIIDHDMVRMPKGVDGLTPARRRRVIQLVFIFVNLALVEAHLPGPLWLVLGGIFWVGLLAITLAGSNLVCGTMCWIGAIQDIFEPFARPRFRFNARLGRTLTLLLLVVWMPIGWLVLPARAAHDRMPIDLSLGWERHLFQFALAGCVALSVVFLGRRGICRFLCPFNAIVASIRRPFVKPTRAPLAASCTSACIGCSRHDAGAAVTYERSLT